MKVFWLLILNISLFQFKLKSQECAYKVPVYDPLNGHYFFNDDERAKNTIETYERLQILNIGNEFFFYLSGPGKGLVRKPDGHIVYKGPLVIEECFRTSKLGTCAIVSDGTGYGLMSMETGNLVLKIEKSDKYRVWHDRYLFRINKQRKVIIYNDLLNENRSKFPCTKSTRDIIPLNLEDTLLFYSTDRRGKAILYELSGKKRLYSADVKKYFRVSDSLVMIELLYGSSKLLNTNTGKVRAYQNVSAVKIENCTGYLGLKDNTGYMRLADSRLVIDSSFNNMEKILFTGRYFLLKIKERWRLYYPGEKNVDTLLFDNVFRPGQYFFGQRSDTTINLSNGGSFGIRYEGKFISADESYVITQKNNEYLIYWQVSGKLIRRSSHYLRPIGLPEYFEYTLDESKWGVEDFSGKAITEAKYVGVMNINCGFMLVSEFSDRIKGMYLIDTSGVSYIKGHF